MGGTRGGSWRAPGAGRDHAAAGGEASVDDCDEVEHAGDGGEEGAQFVDAADALGVGGRATGDGEAGLGVATFAREGGAEDALLGVHDLEVLLVDVVDAEGDWADEGFAEEPDAVFLAVDDVDAADEDAAEEEAENPATDPPASPGLAAEEVAKSWEDDGEDECCGIEARIGHEVCRGGGVALARGVRRGGGWIGGGWVCHA